LNFEFTISGEEMKKWTIEEINQLVDGTLEGETHIAITGLEEITEAQSHQLTFIGEKKYVRLWKSSKAAAAIINESFKIEPGPGRALIRVPNADLAMGKVLEQFEPALPICEPGIHPTAVVDPTAQIGEYVAIGAGCYVGARVVVGANTTLYPNVTILDDSQIGSHTVIWSGTVIRERCKVGDHCILHANVSIGTDGFGYRPSPDGKGMVKIPQIGTVVIGNWVELGSGTCVDRGKFSATSIGDHTKIDNLVQIGHNCKLGQAVVISGQSGLAGTVTLGNGVVIGGASHVRDHVNIGDGVMIGGGSGVTGDVEPGRIVAGFPADDAKKALKIWSAQKRLPELVKLLKKQ
jgi:UDP-3-O-[3-hydroxymyristoyl] glucosamine N-acyltransferase